MPPGRRSQPFPLGFEAYLERLIVGEKTSAELKVPAGHVLFLTHTRASKAMNRRGRALPLLAVAEGFQHEWATAYLDARKALQISAGEDKPFLRAVVDGTVQPHSWSLSDAVCFISHHLSQASEAGDIPVVPVGSFDASLGSKDTRRLLGHHTVQSDGAWLAYSADALHGLMKRQACNRSNSTNYRSCLRCSLCPNQRTC
eukprot:872426-Amphidinium_carterae.1